MSKESSLLENSVNYHILYVDSSVHFSFTSILFTVLRSLCKRYYSEIIHNFCLYIVVKHLLLLNLSSLLIVM